MCLIFRLKGERANLKTEVKRKQSTPNFPKNEHFLRTYAYQGIRNVYFSENLAYFVLLLPPF